jgi:hypothetical protein
MMATLSLLSGAVSDCVLVCSPSPRTQTSLAQARWRACVTRGQPSVR